MVKSAKKLDVQLDAEAAAEIASRSRGTPRIANRLLKRVRDFALVHNHVAVGLNVAREALQLYGIDELGLDRIDRTVLDCLVNRFAGKPVGLSTLAVAVGEEQDTIDSVVEPYLIRLGLVTKTPRGRQATAAALRHMGKGSTDGLFGFDNL